MSVAIKGLINRGTSTKGLDCGGVASGGSGIPEGALLDSTGDVLTDSDASTLIEGS